MDQRRTPDDGLILMCIGAASAIVGAAWNWAPAAVRDMGPFEAGMLCAIGLSLVAAGLYQRSLFNKFRDNARAEDLEKQRLRREQERRERRTAP